MTIFHPGQAGKKENDMSVRKFPWKKSFAKVPPPILKTVAGITTERIFVAQTKAIEISDIASGLYKHLGLALDGGQVTVSEPVVPPPSSGKWSMRNQGGWERKRYDLPKITKTYSWETPNFGDPSYGTHTTSRDREVYQVEFDEPRGHAIEAEILRSSEGDRPMLLVKFAIDAVLDKTESGFEKELLWALNVLQENTGVAGVYPSDATRIEYLGTIALDWEVFPPGNADEVIRLLRKGRTGRATKADGIMEERVRLLSSLKPTNYFTGTAKFAAYVGAQFTDDLVVFENVRYGNALYVLYDDWRDISKRSRIDLLKGTSERFDRFAHTDGWEGRFQEHIRNELDARNPKTRR
jgi:hypothetical protein